MAGAREHGLRSLVVSAPLVPPVWYRKAHSLNLLNGGSRSGAVKHKPVFQGVLRRQYESVQSGAQLEAFTSLPC